MVLFEQVLQNAEALKRVGERALSDARKAWVPVYYMEATYGSDIIREFPDGRRERGMRQHGSLRFVPIPPRTS